MWQVQIKSFSGKFCHSEIKSNFILVLYSCYLILIAFLLDFKDCSFKDHFIFNGSQVSLSLFTRPKFRAIQGCLDLHCLTTTAKLCASRVLKWYEGSTYLPRPSTSILSRTDLTDRLQGLKKKLRWERVLPVELVSLVVRKSWHVWVVVGPAAPREKETPDESND